MALHFGSLSSRVFPMPWMASSRSILIDEPVSALCWSHPIADKALLVSMFVTLGLANQLWTSLVILVVFRDVMIIGGFLLIQAFSIPKRYDPLYISKINTGLQIALVAFVLARLGLGTRPELD